MSEDGREKDLPKRDPGASPMAAAGAKAREAAASANGGNAQYTIKRLGAPPARSTRRHTLAIAVAAAVTVLAASGGALASLGTFGGNAGHPTAMPSRVPTRAGASPAASRPLASPATSQPSPATSQPSASPSRATSAPSPASPAQGQAPVASMQVAGVGCPGDSGEAVTQNDAPTGPGWMPGGGGWTGNGCDGSTLWTMDPNGHKPVSSSLTWSFTPPPQSSRCTLAVFIPTQNALGTSDYSVSAGGQVVAVVPVNQAAATGQWWTLGTFTVSGSPLEITTAPAPGASGPGHHGAIAASAARADCS